MGSKILLADDSITIQKVVNLTFADEGIEVVAVSNGDMAERRLEEVNPDLVLADIFMPGKNGYELCEAIKKNPLFSKVPVVLLIGAFEPFNEAEARRVRADAHLTKPFESRTLVETVRKLMTARPRTGPIGPAPTPEAKHPEPQAAQQILQPAPPAHNPNVAPIPVATDASMRASFDTLDESAPLDFDYTPAEAPASSRVEAHFDGADSGSVSSFTNASSWKRNTDDLSFATDQAPFQAFGLDDLSAETSGSLSPVSVAIEQEPLDFPANSPRSGVPSAFRNAEEFMLDFNKPAGRADYEEVAFEVSSRDPLDVITDEGAGEIEFQPSGEGVEQEQHNFKTTMLQKPSGFDVIEPIDTNPLEMPESSSANHEPSFNLTESDTAQVDPASLLGADEPLGDVLIDETAPESFSPDQQQPLAGPLDQTLDNEALNIEFIPREQDEPTSPTGKMTATATSELEAIAGEHESAQGVSSEWLPSTAKEFAGGDSFDLVSPSAEAVVNSETGFEAIQEISPSPEIGSAEAGSALVDEAPANSFVEREAEVPAEAVASPDSGFTSYSMWSEEETKFAPIDIEATTIDEPQRVESAVEAALPERGFDFAPVASEESLQAEQPVQTTEPVEPAPALEASTAQPAASQIVEISPALIDEIARRVVAQISEATVREIAWEVVPDCVERVIKEMTKQELQKRA